MADKEKKKKPYKVIGVNALKSYPAFAKKVENELNKAREDGYTIRGVNFTEKGALILCEYVSPQNQFPFLAARGAVAAPPVEDHQDEHGHELPKLNHPESIGICNFVLRAMHSAPPTDYKNILEKISPEFCRSKSPTEILTIADDIEREAKHHETHHQDPGKTCVIPAIFTATAEYLRSIGRPGIN